jgi:hypothetical protein
MTDREAGAGELPDLNEDNRLVLMAVDPYLVHAYWNVSAGRIEAANGLFDEEDLEAAVLRFHDVTGIAADDVSCHASFDVDVQLEAGKCYARLGAPERRYRADLGLRAKDGRLVALVRSNPIEMPPAWPHVKVDDAATLVEPPPAAPQVEPAIAFAEPPAAPPDSHQVLERKLAETAALREEPLPPAVESAAQADLAALGERNLTPGISSLLVGARRGKQ